MILNPRTDAAGNVTGDPVYAGDEVRVDNAPTTLDRYKAGLNTPRLNAFNARNRPTEVEQPQVAQTPEQPPGSSLPQKDGSYTAPDGTGTPPSTQVAAVQPEKTPAQEAEAARQKRLADPVPNWKSLSLADRQSAYKADPELRKQVPQPGANAFIDRRLELARERVKLEGQGKLARQRYAAFNSGFKSNRQDVQAEDRKTLAATGTIAVDPRYAGPGQLTTDKDANGVYVKKADTVPGMTAGANPWFRAPNNGIVAAADMAAAKPSPAEMGTTLASKTTAFTFQPENKPPMEETPPGNPGPANQAGEADEEEKRKGRANAFGVKTARV